LYQVSNQGQVKSLERIVEWKGEPPKNKNISEKILKPAVSNGYCLVSLYDSNKIKKQ
jgi:hypothetical protein